MDVFSSTTESPTNSSLVRYAIFPDWYYDAEHVFNYVLTYLQIIGFFLNVFHFAVLSRKEMRSNAVYRLMIGICSNDLIGQVVTFLIWSPFWIRVDDYHETTKCLGGYTYRDAWIVIIGAPVLDVVQRNSSWLALLMALYRTVSVMFPMSTSMQKMSKPRVAVYTILVVSVVSTVWGFVAFGRHRIQARDSLLDCNGNMVGLEHRRYTVSVPSSGYDLHQKIVSIYGLIKALPSLIDPVLTVLLLVELRRAKKRWNSLSKGEPEKTDHTTKIIVFMTISFFILEVPNGISHFFLGSFHDDVEVFTVAMMIATFAEILPIINSSSHIFVCILMSSQYRETARYMVFGAKSKITMVQECGTTSHNGTKA